jgi:hypothetical protein
MGSIMMGMQVAGAVTSAQGAAQQSQATKAAYEYQSAVSSNNAQLAQWQAQDALQRGAQAEQQQRLKTAQLKGSQRARLAANGVALDEGSALNVLQDTDYMGGQDAMTIRDNAAREAWGYRTQAGNYASDASMLQSRADAEDPDRAMFGSLLGSAGSVASSWYKRKTTTTSGG